MAGYLGKISAVISANTAGFRRGVNEAAQDTRNFARAVEQNLRKASSDAAKSLQSILTPIQQVQASLRAAGEQGLSFRGFRGAIRDIEELKQRLTSLSAQDTRLVLRITGQRTLAELQQQIRDISNRDVQIVARVGGAEGIAAGIERITQARDALSEDANFGGLLTRISEVNTRLSELKENLRLQLSVSGASGDLGEARQLKTDIDLLTQSLTELEGERRRVVSQRVGLNIDFSDLDELTNRIRGVNLASLPRAMNELTASQFQAAEASMMRLVTVADGLSKPLAQAVGEFGKLDLAVQANFLPTLSQVQNEVQELNVSARATGDGFEDAFNRIEARADAVIASIRQMSELAKSVSSLSTGNELRFQQPEIVGSLGRAKAFGDAAAPLMESASPQVRQETIDRLRQILALSEDVERQFAAMQDAMAGGRAFIATNIQSQINSSISEINRLVSEGKTALNIDVDTGESQPKVDKLVDSLTKVRQNIAFTITGEVQNFDQVKAELNRLIADVGKLDASNVGVFGADLNQLAEIIDSGDLANLQQARDLIASIQRQLGAATKVELDAKDAKREADQLAAAIERLRAEANLVITARPQNLDQVQSELQKVLSTLADVEQAQRAAFLPKIEGVLSSVQAGNAGEAASRLVALRDEVAAAVPPKPTRTPAAAKPADDLGPALGSSERGLNSLKSTITSLKSQLDTLPAGMRQQFVPAIQAAEAEYRRLFSTAGVTAGEIQEAAENLQGLQQGVTRAANAATQFGGTFAQFRDNADARVAAAGLEYLRTTLSRATGDTTRAAAALDALSAAQQRAASTPNGFRDNAAELQRLTNEAIEAASAVDGVGASAGGIRRGFARVGDVARGSFGNVGLAVQQAAFAFEDFFSVTGGFDQRIRAAGNNLSQLGFILGGTTGLIAGISAAIGSQLVVALINWYNEGRTTEDQVKALNDALSRQKSLVEELKQAFESLGDSIARRAFSEPARQAREFANELQRVEEKQRRLREDRVAGLDADVQRERANQNRINRDLERESDPGRRVVLQRELNESQRRERAAARAAMSRPLPSNADVAAAVTRAGDREFAARTRGQEVVTPEDTRILDEARRRANAAAGASPLELRRILEEQLAALGTVGSDGATAASAAELQRLINSLEDPVRAAVDQLSNGILKSSFAAAVAIESAQQDVADAIRRGVQGAAAFRNALDRLAGELDQAQRDLKDAQEIDDPTARETAVRAAQTRVDAVRARQDEVNRGARDARLGRTFGGERTTQALAAMQGNDRFANEVAATQAYLVRAIDQELEARRRLDEAIISGDDAATKRATADLDAAQKASESAAAFAEAIVALEGAVGRLRKLANSALSQSEGIADNAQRRLTENPTAGNRRRRDEAELQLIADRERLAKANNELDARRSILGRTGGTRIEKINDELEAITQERKRLEEEAKKNGTFLSATDAQRLADREAELIAERERRTFQLTEAQRKQIDAINEEIAARQRMIDFENEVRDRRKPVGNDIRGLDLLERPGERAGREARQQIADIRAATGGAIAMAIKEGRFGEIAGIQARGREAEKRAVEDQARNTAPAIFALADSVQNALLQGPSRAALQASDVSTMDGQRELYRLMRGDDPSKNENLIELRKQSEALDKLVQAAERGPDVVDIN